MLTSPRVIRQAQINRFAVPPNGFRSRGWRGGIEFPESNIVGPATIGATSFSIHLHVDNADEVLDHAVRLGATLLRPATDHFYGERSGTLRAPFGHEWLIGHSIETVTPEEMQARYTKLFSNEGL